MHISLNLALIFVLTNLVVPTDIPSQLNQTFDEWSLEKEGDGIEVYTRAVEGSDIKEFKAIAFTNKSMSSLERLIEDADNYHTWQVNVTTSKLLKKVNDSELYIYYTTDIPWPLSDRDVLIYSKKAISDNGTVTYAMKGIPEYFKESDDYTRIKVVKGIWEFTPVNENQIKIVFQFYGDPDGWIPNWLINLFIVTGPYGTLENMIAIE